MGLEQLLTVERPHSEAMRGGLESARLSRSPQNWQRSAILKGFRTPAIHWREGRTEAGVGKAWKEETAGEFAPTLVSIYGEFAGAG